MFEHMLRHMIYHAAVCVGLFAAWLAHAMTTCQGPKKLSCSVLQVSNIIKKYNFKFDPKF